MPALSLEDEVIPFDRAALGHMIAEVPDTKYAIEPLD
jgi:hypothetical protein